MPATARPDSNQLTPYHPIRNSWAELFDKEIFGNKGELFFSRSELFLLHCACKWKVTASCTLSSGSLPISLYVISFTQLSPRCFHSFGIKSSEHRKRRL
ncbi:Uncharacterized protein HZ326_6802 [Fusarium oxysporum f. sp. albedinis]|nr:Uncharacterized protein HZ326_6802 [Fusarium oxysporum f. sp. albedinis]